MPDPDAESHLVERVRRALAEDPRAGILDASVTIRGDTVVVAGRTETDARRSAVTLVVAELLPRHRVTNRMIVAEPVSGPDEPEALG